LTNILVRLKCKRQTFKYPVITANLLRIRNSILASNSLDPTTMIPTSNLIYEFGGYRLNPNNRLLYHFERQVEISGRDFDILLYLVQNPNTLMQKSEITQAVWGKERAMHEGNLSNHIAKIRKTLGCDPHRPTFIRTLRGGRGGYRFVAPVKASEMKVPEEEMLSPAQTKGQMTLGASNFEIDAHIFVPVFLGSHVFDQMPQIAKETEWLPYKEIEIRNGRLCVLPAGIAVVHLTRACSFPALVDVANWRKAFYKKIFDERAGFGRQTDELLKSFSNEDNGTFDSIAGRSGYAYSLLVLKAPRSKDPERIRSVLEILSCPKPLETKDDSKHERSRVLAVERHLLDKGLKSSDIREFGMAGSDLGFASWEGVSYFNLNNADEKDIRDLVDFQIAVHALWWLSKCLTNAWLADPEVAAVKLQHYFPELKRMFMKLKNIGAQESTSQRTMTEAVLAVNRVTQMVEETLELYK
jgi:DNA-binding winged helix-turn-helix (wHTH) protein